jgi:ketosteroid isomerase-like protein
MRSMVGGPSPAVDYSVRNPALCELLLRSRALGVDGLRRYLQDLDETWDEFDVTIAKLRADGEHVVALGRIRGRQRDVAVDDPAGFAFRLRDGKVVWAKVYRSQEEALAAVGWS